ncbi:putative Pre-pilin like leader sequence [Thiocapsa sp. KS1]|nr:GspH/FimT family pseudopilin [Thiocapsa sp. KS1]CRI67311.1 putative Pre-pilin like leader sequence [Thiocapsa sp. KS1]
MTLPRHHGFTLIELMAGLAIMFILLALAVPSFRELSARNQLSAATNDLLMGLQLARSEAVRHATRMTLCPSTDEDTCTKDTPWSVGWILFHDPNDNASRDKDEKDERLIQVFPPLPDSVEVSGPAAITYASAGNVKTSVQLAVAQSGSKEARCIRVISSGSISMEKAACGD